MFVLISMHPKQLSINNVDVIMLFLRINTSTEYFIMNENYNRGQRDRMYTVNSV